MYGVSVTTIRAGLYNTTKELGVQIEKLSGSEGKPKGEQARTQYRIARPEMQDLLGFRLTLLLKQNSTETKCPFIFLLDQ